MSTSTCLTQLAYIHYCLHRNLEGITHEESLHAAASGGNCINWVVGHLVASRQGWLAALGLEGITSPTVANRYRRGGDPIVDPAEATPIAELLAAFDAGQERLVARLGAMPEDELDSPAPFSPGNNPDETWRSLNAGLCFHEAYHVGQTGVLRRWLGRPGVLT